MIISRSPLLAALSAICATLVAQNLSTAGRLPKPGVKEVQVPVSSLRPAATIKAGRTADWVLVTENAVWVATTKPDAVQRIDPATNKIVASIKISGEACSGLASGIGSIWAPICGKKPALVRIDAAKNTIKATLPISPAGPEGGIAASDDSVWLITLNRVNPSTNSVRQKTSIPPGSYNPIFSDGIVWITGVEKNVLTAVEASSGKVLESIPVGPSRDFLRQEQAQCGR